MYFVFCRRVSLLLDFEMLIYFVLLMCFFLLILSAGEEYRVNLLARVEEMDYTQLRMGEWQILYEEKCEGDFQTLRKYVG